MIRYLIALAMTFAWLPAHAQATKPACYPLVNGYPVAAPRVVTGEYGTHIFWYCSDSKGSTPQSAGFSCLKDRCAASTLSAAIYAITRASARVATANAMWAEHVTFDCTPALVMEDSPRGNLCWERAALQAMNRAEWLE